MDVVDNGAVLGDLDGILTGGASIKPGKIGSALHVNGNHYVSYGRHVDECYHNPDKCSDGITWSLWLNLHAYESIIMDTGATARGAFGYYIHIHSNPWFLISVKTATMFHQYAAPYFSPE